MAQLDSASVSGAEGSRFESWWGRSHDCECVPLLLSSAPLQEAPTRKSHRRAHRDFLLNNSLRSPRPLRFQFSPLTDLPVLVEILAVLLFEHDHQAVKHFVCVVQIVLQPRDPRVQRCSRVALLTDLTLLH